MITVRDRSIGRATIPIACLQTRLGVQVTRGRVTGVDCRAISIVGTWNKWFLCAAGDNENAQKGQPHRDVSRRGHVIYQAILSVYMTFLIRPMEQASPINVASEQVAWALRRLVDFVSRGMGVTILLGMLVRLVDRVSRVFTVQRDECRPVHVHRRRNARG